MNMKNAEFVRENDSVANLGKSPSVIPSPPTLKGNTVDEFHTMNTSFTPSRTHLHLF